MTVVFDKRTSVVTTLQPFFQSTWLNTYFPGSSPSPKSAGYTTSVMPSLFSSTISPMFTKSFQSVQPLNSQSSDGYHSSISSSSSTSSSSMDISSYPFTYSSFVNISMNGTHGQPPSGKGLNFRGRVKTQFLNL